MATLFTLTRVGVSMLAAAMLSACAGSQMAGTTPSAPQTVGGSSSHAMNLPNDGGGCGGDSQHGFGPNDGGHGCCGGDNGQGAGAVRSDDDGGHHCRNISVSPRSVYFTSSNPGPVTVKINTKEQGTVSEVDDCSGIATVTQGSENQWTVTAGVQQGSCKALFILKNSNGKKIGHAVLHITNFL